MNLKAGDKSKGRNPTSQQIMKGKTGPKQNFNARKNEFREYGDLSKENCSRCQSNRSSHQILHPFKYVPPQVQGLQTCDVERKKPSPMPASGASRVKHQVPLSNGFSTPTPVHKCALVSGPLEDHSVLEKHCNLSDSKQCLQKCAAMSSDSKQCLRKCVTMPIHKPGWPLVKTGWNSVEPCPSSISPGQIIFSEASSPREELQNSLKEATFQTPTDTQRASEFKCANNNIPQGWPFLHQSMAASKWETPHAKARRMSVVEWVLQLPERPKRLLEQQSGPMNQKFSFYSAIQNREICDDISNTEVKQQEAEMVSSTKVEKTLSGKFYQICKSKTCVVFQVADLETATNNFSKGETSYLRRHYLGQSLYMASNVSLSCIYFQTTL